MQKELYGIINGTDIAPDVSTPSFCCLNETLLFVHTVTV